MHSEPEHQTRATTSAATPAADSSARSARRRPHPMPARRRPPTPAAHDAGRQYGVMSVMPGAAVPAKSTVAVKVAVHQLAGALGRSAQRGKLIDQLERTLPVGRAGRHPRTPAAGTAAARSSHAARSAAMNTSTSAHGATRRLSQETGPLQLGRRPRAAAPPPRPPRHGAASGVPATNVSARQPATT